MITGNLTEAGVPVVMLPVAGRTWPAIVDTGFNGDLELPYSLGPSVNARLFSHVRSILAGGQSIYQENYTVEFPFDGETVAAEATFVNDNQILIGTRLLWNHRLEINFVTGAVLLERIT